MSSLTKKEEYIKTFFYPKLMGEEEAESLVKRISSIGEDYGFIGNEGDDERRRHKYDVWVAKQVKEDLSILDRRNDLFQILDWFIQENVNAMSYSFSQAMDGQKRWHERLIRKRQSSPAPLPKEVDEERVIFRCSDNKHFFYLLLPDDLEYEGYHMGNCVGGDNYKSSVKNERSIIFSLRDHKNLPHVTIEIKIENKTELSGKLHQQYGKGNSGPALKYLNQIKEFTLFAHKCLNDDTLDFLNQKIWNNN